MNTVFGVIIGFLILMILVVIHEYGHFRAARKNGVVVEEFGIGFPPRAKAWLRNPDYEKQLAEWKKNGKKGVKPHKWSKLPKSEWKKKQKSLVFSLNYLPIGGFCSMKGESDSDKRPHSFGSASLWAKTKILFAGVAMNWLAAFVIMTVLCWTGMPTFMDNQFHMPGDTYQNTVDVFVSHVTEGSPAEQSGLKVDDQLLKANDTDVITSSDIFTFDSEHAGEDVTYTIRRKTDGDNTEELVIPVHLNEKGSEYTLGIRMRESNLLLHRATWSAPIVAAVNTVQLTGETYRGLWTMVKSLGSGIIKQFSFDESTRSQGASELKTVGDSVSGPVGIIGVLFPASVESGPTTLAFLAALISVSLACMNVLPIPALDGGRFTLIALFRLRKKTLTKETEEKIVARAFIFLLILIAIVTVLDITRFF